jgi:HlyD family secretion protein
VSLGNICHLTLGRSIPVPLRTDTSARRLRWRRPAGAMIGVMAAGIVIWLMRGGAPSKAVGSGLTPEAIERPPTSVTVVHPRLGGIPRTIQQPATMHAFESVDLYAMVSGYLKSQAVDIGSAIKKGEVLAEIDVPRDTKDYDEAGALVAQAKAQVDQAEARIKVARAQQEAAAAAKKVAESDLKRLTARRRFADQQYARVNGLVAQNAAPKMLADEQTSDLAAATAAEQTGSLEILSANAKLMAAVAAIDQTKADAAEAKANLGVAQARLERSKGNLDYATIVAPFDGVVTHRTFHPKAFIRAATVGGEQPLLTVKRTDMMRVVVLVPDNDVVLTKMGDKAVVNVDALGGRPFPGVVARIARAEDTERMMRVEIDLKNPENVLCDGMYGKALINLEQDAKSLAVPAACVVEHSGRSGGFVYVVRDGIARRTEIKLGGDNGTYAEIRSGIQPDDSIVLPSGTPVEDGMRVTVADAHLS